MDIILKNNVKKWQDLEMPLAPLSDKQLEVIQEIKVSINSRSLPTNLPKGEEEKEETNQIETVDKFLSHYSNLEDELLEEADIVYNEYYHQLNEWNNEVVNILRQVDETLLHLCSLKEQYHLVSTKTNQLHEACQQISAHQMVLSKTCEDVRLRLEYFTGVESLLQRLNNPTLSVTSDTFINITNKIDDCLTYCNKNPSFKESPNYIIKYKHCLSRCISMMKQFVSVNLQSTRSQTTQNNLDVINAKFQASAQKLKGVLSNIEQRTSISPEYEVLLQECHEMYYNERKLLMSSSVLSTLLQLAEQHRSDHCTLVRTSCTFLVHLSTDEYQLFLQFFSQPTPSLTSYLEDLCSSLYDILRPIIIHVNHLETLAELCSILRLEMLEEHVQSNPLPLEAFSKIAWQLLQDVQERLVFRAHLYFQSDILGYKPTHGDLAYPEKLEMMESIALELEEQSGSGPLKRSESRSSVVSVGSLTSQEVARINISGDERVQLDSHRSRISNSPSDLHGMWYPPVRRTLLTLSRLYRCVERSIFQGLSQEALTACVNNLSQATVDISNKSSVLDGKLFEIKHLLILREQVAPFQVDFSIKEMSLDFTKVKSAAYGLIQKRNRLFSLGSNNAILEFLLEGTPTLCEHVVDSRKEIDKHLKQCCEQFISHCIAMIVKSLDVFLSKADTFIKMTKETNQSQTVLRNQPFATPEIIGAVVGESLRQVKNKIGIILRAMQLYLANRETEMILYRPIKNSIVNSFSRLSQLIGDENNGYSDDDRIITACPTTEHVLVILSAVLASGHGQQVETIQED